MIDKIIDFSLKNRLLVCLLAFFISVVGMVVYRQMPKDIYPDLNAPIVNIITTNEGMAAEDVERLITFPLESLLNGTPGVTRVRSESTTGESVVTVEFDWGMDIYLARQIVMGKLDLLLDELPTGTSRPTLGPVSSRMGEIFEFAVTGEGVSPLELRSISDWQIRYRLLGVQGVSFIVNLGGFVKQYQVFLNPNMMKHYDIIVKDVKEAIEGSNRNFSGGMILKKNQELLIKGIGKIQSTDYIGSSTDTGTNKTLHLVGQGAKEIGNYLFAATLIIIFVFLPLLTIEGIGGRMFRPTAFAVAAALFGSLIINITLQPVLMSIPSITATIWWN